MHTEPITPRPAGWHNYQLETAHTHLNALYGDMTEAMAGTGAPTVGKFAEQLQQIITVQNALYDVSGHDGIGDAAIAARDLLPGIQRAAQLLEALEGRPVTAADIQPLLTDVGAAMDRIEKLLGAVGFD
jgi:hypothetical protein